ncbi:unnamed protein product, partial [Sphagnum compactum]
MTQTMLTWPCSCCMTTFVTQLRLCMAALRHAPVQHNIIVCCTVPTRPCSRCSVCSMLTNSVGSGTCS